MGLPSVLLSGVRGTSPVQVTRSLVSTLGPGLPSPLSCILTRHSGAYIPLVLGSTRPQYPVSLW